MNMAVGEIPRNLLSSSAGRKASGSLPKRKARVDHSGRLARCETICMHALEHILRDLVIWAERAPSHSQRVAEELLRLRLFGRNPRARAPGWSLRSVSVCALRRVG